MATATANHAKAEAAQKREAHQEVDRTQEASRGALKAGEMTTLRGGKMRAVERNVQEAERKGHQAGVEHHTIKAIRQSIRSQSQIRNTLNDDRGQDREVNTTDFLLIA